MSLQLDAADLGQAGRVEQQDRAAVVGQGGAGIEAGRHHRRCGRLDHQFLMVVDAVDGQRIDIAAGRAQHDQAARLVDDIAVQAEHLGQ